MSLAHEGNPKEDTIVIAGGDVLSTAQLDIDFLFFGGAPGVPSTAEPGFLERSSSCADVFEWRGENDNNTFLGSAAGTPWLTLRETGLTGGSYTKLYDQTLDLHINSTRTCYGLLWQQVWPLSFSTGVTPAAGSEVYWQVTFDGVIDGTPRSGPAVWIDDASTKEVATLFALVVDMDVQLTKLVRWQGASVASLNNATLLATMAAPSISQTLVIDMQQFPSSDGGGFNGVFGTLLATDNSTTVDSCSYFFDDAHPYNGSTQRHSKMNVGFVSVGGETGGKCGWRYRAGASISASTPFVIIATQGGT